MPSRILTKDERDRVTSLLDDARDRLRDLAGNDDTLLWAMRRKLYKEMTYDERGKPMQRRAPNTLKRE